MSEFKDNDIFFVNQGANEVTIIVDDRNGHLINGDLLLKQENLALITLHDSTPGKNYRGTPGFVHAFLSNISKRGINLNDILSTHSQVTLIMEQKYLLEVYKICDEVTKLKHL